MLYCLLLTMAWVWEATPLEVREYINQQIMQIEAEEPSVYRVVNQKVNGVPIRVYFPSEENKRPVSLMIHGGGWVAGNLETHDYMARYLCQKGEAVIVSVEYSLAPEEKFPIQLEECYAILEWIHTHPEECNADLSCLTVLGDSAGGNMTAALCLMAQDRGGPSIQQQILINPSIDLTQGAEDSFMRWFSMQYVKEGSDLSHPYASPIKASHLQHLPPALVILAEKDELLEEGLAYGEALKKAGVPTRIYEQKGIGHLAGYGARATKEARESLDVVAELLRCPFCRLCD